MPKDVIKKVDGFEYVDEDDDRTIDAAIKGFNDDSDPDPDEKEIMNEWLPKAFPDEPDRQLKGRPISIPEMEEDPANSQFLKSDGSTVTAKHG